MERTKGALVIFGDVAGKAGKDVAFAVGAIVREGQPQHFAEKGVANVAHHIGTDYGDLDKGKVRELMLFCKNIKQKKALPVHLKQNI